MILRSHSSTKAISRHMGRDALRTALAIAFSKPEFELRGRGVVILRVDRLVESAAPEPMADSDSKV